MGPYPVCLEAESARFRLLHGSECRLTLTQDNRFPVPKLPFIYVTSDKPFEITPCILKFKPKGHKVTVSSELVKSILFLCSFAHILVAALKLLDCARYAKAVRHSTPVQEVYCPSMI